MKKVGVIITTHSNNKEIIINCIESFIKNIPKSTYIVVYGNEVTDKKLVKKLSSYKNIEFILVKDQIKNFGLTGTWNQRIDKCFKNDCKIIIISNHDIIVDDTLIHILKEVDACDKDKLQYYAPRPLIMKKVLRWQAKSANISANNILNHYKKYGTKKGNVFLIKNWLWGCFQVFPKHVLIKNKYNNKLYFNNKNMFWHQEQSWFKRFSKKGGIGVYVPKTTIIHGSKGSYKNLIMNNNNNCKLHKFNIKNINFNLPTNFNKNFNKNTNFNINFNKNFNKNKNFNNHKFMKINKNNDLVNFIRSINLTSNINNNRKVNYNYMKFRIKAK